MHPISDKVELLDIPAHVESWAVAKVKGFVPAILQRWRRAHPDLPDAFLLIMCPVAEVNAGGGLPVKVHTLTDPRLTCRHFTGCSRPYYAMVLAGEDAEKRCHDLQMLLPWSESYSVQIRADHIRMHFLDATEDMDSETSSGQHHRRLVDLLESGELLQILA